MFGVDAGGSVGRDRRQAGTEADQQGRGPSDQRANAAAQTRPAPWGSRPVTRGRVSRMAGLAASRGTSAARGASPSSAADPRWADGEPG